jgi:hypothetical protein
MSRHRGHRHNQRSLRDLSRSRHGVHRNVPPDIKARSSTRPKDNQRPRSDPVSNLPPNKSQPSKDLRNSARHSSARHNSVPRMSRLRVLPFRQRMNRKQKVLPAKLGEAKGTAGHIPATARLVPRIGRLRNGRRNLSRRR